jgi:hypothetical protein
MRCTSAALCAASSGVKSGKSRGTVIGGGILWRGQPEEAEVS